MKLKIEVQHMQGAAFGTNCLKVTEDDGTHYGKTLGFVIPINFCFEGYWGSIFYYTLSLTAIDEHKDSEVAHHTIYDFCQHLGITTEDFFDAAPKNWDKINTDFYKGRF